MFRLFAELSGGDSGFRCDLEFLTESYNEFFPPEDEDGEDIVTKAQLKKVMSDLEKDVLFVKGPAASDGSAQWSAKNLSELKFLINEESEEEPDETDDLVDGLIGAEALIPEEIVEESDDAEDFVTG